MEKRTVKWCWLAKETKNGWKLSLEIANTTLKSNVTFKTIKAVEKYANVFTPSVGKIVFIHLKNTKYPINTKHPIK